MQSHLIISYQLRPTHMPNLANLMFPWWAKIQIIIRKFHQWVSIVLVQLLITKGKQFSMTSAQMRLFFIQYRDKVELLKHIILNLHLTLNTKIQLIKHRSSPSIVFIFGHYILQETTLCAQSPIYAEGGARNYNETLQRRGFVAHMGTLSIESSSGN